jgi:homocysteine S-methyltransferase
MSEKYTFKELLASGKPVISDGAMGTLLHERGVKIDSCFDALNLSQPALVAEVHRDYIEAGAQMIQTNTFGANRFKLGQHGLADKVVEINGAGVDLARKVILAHSRISSLPVMSARWECAWRLLAVCSPNRLSPLLLNKLAR